MRASVLFVGLGLVAVLSLASSGCKKKTAGADDGGMDGGEAGVVDTAAAPTAKNAASVARFQDETKVEGADETIEAARAAVRASPGGGATVTVLPHGATISKIASHEKYFLVTFDDPKEAGTRLMGWVGPEAFTATAVVVAKGDGGAVSVTDAGMTDAGAAAIVDSGAVHPVADAGSAPLAVDAGAKPAAPGGAIVAQPVGGKCAGGFVLMTDDKMCHKTCPSVSDCPPKTFCVSRAGQHVCSITR